MGTSYYYSYYSNGALHPSAASLDGVNLLPFLTGEESGSPHEFLFWRYGLNSAVRRGEWKLVKQSPTSAFRLYGLASDVGETNDLAAAKPELARQLKTQLDRWLGELPRRRRRASIAWPVREPTCVASSPPRRSACPPGAACLPDATDILIAYWKTMPGWRRSSRICSKYSSRRAIVSVMWARSSPGDERVRQLRLCGGTRV